MSTSYNKTVPEARYVIDFKVGQSFGEPQVDPTDMIIPWFDSLGDSSL